MLCIGMHLTTRQAVVETVLDTGAMIGESPVWSADERVLFWIDIKKPALHKFDPQSGVQRCWPVTSDIGGFALLADGTGAVVALRDGLFKLDFGSGALEQLVPAPYDQSQFRFNETACDAAGRLWIGVMCDPLDGKSKREEGALHSFTLAGGLVEAPDRSALHNGMAWSADGQEFYLSHSYQQQILAFAYDPRNGCLGEKRLFATLPEHLGIPDGAALDCEGGYWSACHGGGRLRRFNANGTVDRDILLPVSQPTMCAFGGNQLDELYITSARDGLAADELSQEPLAGALLRARPEIRGLARPCIVR